MSVSPLRGANSVLPVPLAGFEGPFVVGKEKKGEEGGG